MQRREESLYPGDWLRIAEKDLKRVERMLAIHDPEVAGFFLQQAKVTPRASPTVASPNVPIYQSASPP